jgi:hypothetical protein
MAGRWRKNTEVESSPIGVRGVVFKFGNSHNSEVYNVIVLYNEMKVYIIRAKLLEKPRCGK